MPLDVTTAIFGWMGACRMTEKVFSKQLVQRSGGEITRPLVSLKVGVPPERQSTSDREPQCFLAN